MQDDNRPVRQSALSSAREPRVPPPHVLERINGRVLDPATALTIKGVKPRTTVYVGPRLLVTRGPRDEETITALEREADALGWAVDRQQGPHAWCADQSRTCRRHRRGSRWAATTRATTSTRARPPRWSRLDLAVKDKEATSAPDGWVLLQRSRAQAPELADVRHAGLEHVVASVRVTRREPVPRGPAPLRRGPPAPEAPARRRSPPTRVPGQRGAAADGIRRPAPAPPATRSTGRRPVVATLDTGCGEHPWLDGVVRTDVKLGTQPDRLRRRRDRPGEVARPVRSRSTARIDPLAGHGTFIAGLIHQACPDADIVAWRIVGADGLVVESNLVKALEDIAELARRHRDGEPGGHPIDVLSLSLGYYHETPEDELFDPTMYGILRKLGECGVAVVCSAGNDATARPGLPGRVHARGPTTPDDRALRARRRPDRRRSARSTPTAPPTRCSATPDRGFAPTPAAPR